MFALSASVFDEITEVLSRPRFARLLSEARRARVLNILRSQAAWFSPALSVTDCRDAKDNKYLELAFTAGAGTIVTGDEDLLVLHPWRGIRILRPAAYLATFGRPS